MRASSRSCMPSSCSGYSPMAFVPPICAATSPLCRDAIPRRSPKARRSKSPDRGLRSGLSRRAVRRRESDRGLPQSQGTGLHDARNVAEGRVCRQSTEALTVNTKLAAGFCVSVGRPLMLCAVLELLEGLNGARVAPRGSTDAFPCGGWSSRVLPFFMTIDHLQV